QTAMLAEQARVEVREQARFEKATVSKGSRVAWRTMVPVATAAAIALAWGATTGFRPANNQTDRVAAGVGAIGDDVLAEFAHEHSQPLQLEAREARAVRDLTEKYVGVPVHPA